MKIKLQKARNKKIVCDITELITSVRWSGSDRQASRKLEFSVINSPFDSEFDVPKIESGDIIYFYFDGKKRFTGRTLRGTSSSVVGENTYGATDFMNILLKSDVSYNFKNITAEKISATVISDLGLKCGFLAPTNINIASWLIDSDSGYNVILGAYYKAYKSSGIKYMPYMDGIKVCVGKKGESSGVKLKLKTNILKSEFEENAEDIVNKIIIYDETGKKIGTVSSADSINLYGIYQKTLKKSEGVNANSEAESMLKEPSKTAKVDIIGNIDAVSGKSIMLYDDITGLWGKFYIENDTHTFSGGIHTTSLTLAFQNFMENSEEDPKSKHPVSTGEHICFYSAGGDKYHSTSSCGGMVKPVKTTVNEAVKLGKSKCLRCWQ